MITKTQKVIKSSQLKIAVSLDFTGKIETSHGVRFSHPLFFCAQNRIREKQTRVPAESEAEAFSAADFAGIFLSLSSGGAE